MPLFRFQRGNLEDSLATTVIVKNGDELLNVISNSFTTVKYLKIEEYSHFDKRCGWYAQMVLMISDETGKEFVPVGFLSEPF